MDIEKILEERGQQYNRGDSHIANFALAWELREAYRKRCLTTRPDRFKAHDHAMEMVLVKIARIATGEPLEENYRDIIGYTTLAWESIKGENNASKG